MERAAIRFPETEPLSDDEQYAVAANTTLFRMMQIIGNDPQEHVPPAVPTERSELLELCRSLANSPASFETLVNSRNHTQYGYLKHICEELQFTDTDDQLTPQFHIALQYEYAKENSSWMQHYRDNEMRRFKRIRKSVLPFLADKVWPAPVNEGLDLKRRLVEFRIQAEYWIGYCDHEDRST